MRWSGYYLWTTREVPRDAEVVSHQLMVRAGMIKKVAAGIYTYLPFGWRSMAKMEAIVRREMNAAGAIELSMPAVQPAELWRESGRWQRYGKELLRIRDRHERDFCFGPTHEEVVTDIVRHDLSSYRQLPVNLYQIQTKFRDEIRPRFGLMRGREFTMKDAYSFHADEETLDMTYQEMYRAYEQVFAACKLDYTVVEADTGAIGGSSSHEFMVVAETGESAIVRCPDCDYAANVEKAEAAPLALPPATAPEERVQVDTPGAHTVQQVAEMLDVPAERVVKTLLYEAEQGVVAVLIRGDREVNEIKLANLLDVPEIRLASDETVQRVSGAPVGFAGPLGLADDVRLIGDESVRGLTNVVVGANAADSHWTGVNWDRDVDIAEWQDLLMVADGDACPQCDGTLVASRGIEVGHIFKLGTKYSEAMQCVFLDDSGESHPMIMGCYGLGIGRTVAAAIEQSHDDDGIIWPLPLAPFEVLLIALNQDDEAVGGAAEALYDDLTAAGVDVLYDDRAERPGVKFNDADLIGIPIRVVVGARSLAEGQIELSLRRDRERKMVAVAEALAAVQELRTDLL
jgi:prolyl-tRNA synthetase